MFKIDFSVYICYYLISQIVLFLSLWLWGNKRIIKHRSLVSDQVWQCAICLYVFFESKASKISKCPLCGSFNQRAGKKLGGAK